MSNPDGNAPMADVGSYDDSGRLQVNLGAVGDDAPLATKVTGYTGLSATITETPTLATAEHAAGDVVGGLLTFDDAARTAAGSGFVAQVTIVDDAGADVEMELWLFNDQPDAIADDAAFAPTADDLHNVAGIFSTTDGSWRAAGTPSVCAIPNKVCQFNLVSGTDLYGYLVTRAAYTPAAATNITVMLGVTKD